MTEKGSALGDVVGCALPPLGSFPIDPGVRALGVVGITCGEIVRIVEIAADFPDIARHVKEAVVVRREGLSRS